VAFLVAVLPLVATCGHSSTGPGQGPYGDGFYLAAVGNEPVPATVVNWPDYHLVFLADTIRLTGGDRWTRTRSEEFTGLTGVPQATTTEQSGTALFGPWRVVLQPDCPPDADCALPLELVPQDGEYLMEYRLNPDSSVVLHYRVLGHGAGS
jgi:hypothetical protein